MKPGTPKRMLARVLVMTVILSLGVTTAFADEEITNVEVKADDSGTSVSAYEDVNIHADQDTKTITVGGDEGGDSSLPADVTPVTVEVKNDVSGKGTTVSVEGSGTQSASETTVELGNVTMSTAGAEHESAIYASGSNVTVTAESAKATSNANNNINAVDARDGAQINVVSASADTAESDMGVSTAVGAIDAYATVDSATAKSNRGTAYGVFAFNENSQVTSVTVKKDATAESLGYDAVAIHASFDAKVDAGSANVTATTTDGKATGVEVEDGGNVQAGTVRAEAKGSGSAVGIDAQYGAEVTANTVTATSKEGDAIAISVTAADYPETKVTVNGDAESSKTGVAVNAWGGAKAIVEIDGTLKVADGGTPVLIADGVTEEAVEITVWKVEVNGEQAKEGEIVKAQNEGQKAAAKAVEESIQYIIQIKPEQANNIKSSKDKAKANETFTVTVTAPEGKDLDAVYTDTGEKLEATRNADGTYSVTVRVGGGMLLNAKFSDKSAAPDVPDPTNTGGTVKLIPEVKAYTMFLATKIRMMTFVRPTLAGFQKYSDKFVINTPYGNHELSLAELLNFNEKGVNFRIAITDTALEIYVNGELFRSIPLSDLI